MTLNDFYNEVARRADTDKTGISAAETRRVLSEAFLVLSKQPASGAADLFSKGLAAAEKKAAAPKKKAAKKKTAKKKVAKKK